MSEAPRAIRRALVTGASGALGEAIAERLGRALDDVANDLQREGTLT